MVAGYEVGSAYLTILPSMQGFAASLGAATTGPFMAAATMGAGVAAGGRPSFLAGGGALGKVFIGAFAAIGAAGIIDSVVGFFGDAVEAATDLFETQNKASEIFGDGTAAILEYSKTAASELGQTRQTFLDGASTFGIFGSSAGLAGEDLSAFSVEMVTLATDLASFNNTSPEDAILAIGAALRGESEPIRRYGVLLDDATLKAQAFTQGIYDGTGALTPQQRVLAAHAEILAQTSTQQGDFARTSDGLANSQRIATAEMENMKAEIGTALLPVVTELFALFKDTALPVLQQVAQWFTDNPEAVRAFVIGLVNGILLIIDGFLAWQVIQSSFNDFFITVLTNMIQAFLNFVEVFVDGSANAFGWLPGVGDDLTKAREDFEAFREDADRNFTALRAGADFATQGFNTARDGVHDLQDAVRALDGSTATVHILMDELVIGRDVARSGYYENRHTGGPVVAGRPYVVGETEPELFVPDRSGMIYNQSQLAAMAGVGAGSGVTNNWTINEVTDPVGTARTVLRYAAERAV